MHQIITITIFIGLLYGCKKDPILAPCEPASLDGSVFNGQISLCNSQQGLQQDFNGIATISFNDKVLILNISSLDSIFQWNYQDSTNITCVYPEGNLSYKLLDLLDNAETGYIRHGNILFFSIKHNPCSTSRFEGWR